MQTLDYQQLNQKYYGMFNVWNDTINHAWIKKNWTLIEQDGLAIYSNAIEEAWVKLRVLSMAVLYREVSYLLCDESIEVDILLLADELELDRNTLKKLVAENLDVHVSLIDEAETFETEDTPLLTEYEMEQYMVYFLLDRIRPQITSLFFKKYVDDTKVFYSFLECFSEDDEQPSYQYSAPLIGGAPQLFNWVSEKMPQHAIYC